MILRKTTLSHNRKHYPSNASPIGGNSICAAKVVLKRCSDRPVYTNHCLIAWQCRYRVAAVLKWMLAKMRPQANKQTLYGRRCCDRQDMAIMPRPSARCSAPIVLQLYVPRQSTVTHNNSLTSLTTSTSNS